MLQVKNLRTYFFRRFKPTIKAVDGISYEVQRGETLALVGESGCGKTVSALSLLRLNPPTSTIVDGQVSWKDRDILSLDEEEICRIRGKDIAMIFQNPLSSLNPLMTIGGQISEALQTHRSLSKRDSWVESKRMLDLMAVPDINSKMEAYPFQLSGGMRQRVMIAMALSCDPSLLIADEPTTALDVIVEAQFLDLLADLGKKFNLTIILITHNLGNVAQLADRITVMYGGNMAEVAPAGLLFENPLHPYTQGLLASIPNIKLDQPKLETMPGSPPDLVNPPPGCVFHPRCPQAMDICREKKPLTIKQNGHLVSCWLYR